MISPYKLARKILPLSIQSKLGNRHKVKRKTLDPLLFNFTSHPQEERLLHESISTQNISREWLEDNPFIPSEIIDTYRRWYNKGQVQQVIKATGDIFIEPITGWPMGKRNQLYLSLYPAGITPYMPVPAYRSIVHKTPYITLDKVISLRNTNEAGYSHFYTDLMAKLLLIRRTGVDLKQYTLVVSSKLANTRYGSFLLANSPIFKEVGKVFLQDKEFINCNEAIFAHVFINPTNDPALFQEVIAHAKAAHPTPAQAAERKVFLTRSAHRRRALRNNDEIVEIMRAKGFEIVDADDLTLPQQIELFSACGHLVGIHGAGLVNILYRYPYKLSLFEIREPIRTSLPSYGGYHNMCVAMGFNYGATLGEEQQTHNQSFVMPADRFEKGFNAFWEKYGDN